MYAKYTFSSVIDINTSNKNRCADNGYLTKSWESNIF